MLHTYAIPHVSVISDLTNLHHIAENTLEGTHMSLSQTSIDMLMTDSQVDLVTHVQTLLDAGEMGCACCSTCCTRDVA